MNSIFLPICLASGFVTITMLYEGLWIYDLQLYKISDYVWESALNFNNNGQFQITFDSVIRKYISMLFMSLKYLYFLYKNKEVKIKSTHSLIIIMFVDIPLGNSYTTPSYLQSILPDPTAYWIPILTSLLLMSSLMATIIISVPFPSIEKLVI